MSDVCDLCRSSALEPVHAPDGSTRGLTVHLCASCGLVQSLPRIDRAARAPAAVSGGADWGNVRYGKGFRTSACMERLTRHIDLSKNISVLDVGSNRGSFARAFLEAAPNASLTALEPDERVVKSCENLPRTTLIEARIEHVSLPDSSFDVVHSCHTIEHLASPAATLKDHARVLKDDGILVIDAPNIALLGSDEIVEEWFIDKHLYHFSASTLRAALEDAGFDIVEGPDENDRENILFVARKAAASKPAGIHASDAVSARALVARYRKTRLENFAALARVSQHLQSLAPRRVALWGAGRLFDALVRQGGFDPKHLTLLIDAPLKAHMDTRHGVALATPEALADAKPGVIVVMSRAFAAEITKTAAKLAPQADILIYADLIAEARLLRAA
jgi:SAM-dependent methyltransferase